MMVWFSLLLGWTRIFNKTQGCRPWPLTPGHFACFWYLGAARRASQSLWWVLLLGWTLLLSLLTYLIPIYLLGKLFLVGLNSLWILQSHWVLHSTCHDYSVLFIDVFIWLLPVYTLTWEKGNAFLVLRWEKEEVASFYHLKSLQPIEQ